ncbi:S-methyl-5-thioribose-1-phosphate isomerase [Oceanicoccus sagamiensis]|uniref:Methylthioribose-1-phosphate isomerase n=1 Tax=Oceanicoccus sagamiensis TaxID=716816 RepID=A0A1X9NC74_9GAMM|nr:S-methyl-5-thioribose-1-phosphate isomerase [Oceanicoccus sagamiensis]ARN74644.1 S-methyl-5-thioribose-1-phosphate isomerase [Oceanicoccus sagamiensis]
MQVNGTAHTTIAYDPQQQCVRIIDQTLLPHRFEIIPLQSLHEFCAAISDMQVRGAPLIGITAAYGLALSLHHDASAANEQAATEQLLATRPTAVNLRWAITRVQNAIKGLAEPERAAAALQEAEAMRLEDSATCEAIGEHGLSMLQTLDHSRPINILTHCNAGWLATVDWGTALAPIYKAHQAGLDIHIWVDETRPRNQGASLTAWELQQQGIPHTVIADNTGGHLMQQGMVDLCLVGSDRTTASGDVCNKIGTYLKALAASDNHIPFYVALPASTIDWEIDDGLRDIPIEQRSAKEVTHITGINQHGELHEVQLVANSPACNYAFDVTPARLVSGLITEHGIYQADKISLQGLKRQR